MLVQIDPLGRLTTFTYTELGQQQSKIDPRGVIGTMVYDPVGRMNERVFSNDTRFTFVYDSLGNRVVMADATSTFDPLNRPLEVTAPNTGTITYAYDSIGNRAQMIDPDGGVFTYAHDAAGRIKWLVNPFEERTTFTFDPLGREESQVLANGVRVSNTYDLAGNLELLTHQKDDGTPLSSFAYQYDPVGNRLNLTDIDDVLTTWTYDEAYRLIREERTGATSYDIEHIYDPVGNRLVEVKDGDHTTFTYDAANQLETKENGDGLTTFTYDGAGNLAIEETPAGTRTNIWTPDNRLSRVILPNSDESSFLYNADGQRVFKEDPAGTSRFLWDARNVLAESTALGASQAVYTLQPNTFGNLLSQRRDTASSFHLFDALGSTANLTNPSASITDSFLYHAYGNIAARTGSTETPYGWVGKVGYQWDELIAQQYVRERHYRIGLASWTSLDRTGLLSLDTNLYRYVHNRPTLFIDASGNGEFCDWVNSLDEKERLKWECGCAILEILDIVTAGIPTVGGLVALLDCACGFVVSAMSCCDDSFEGIVLQLLDCSVDVVATLLGPGAFYKGSKGFLTASQAIKFNLFGDLMVSTIEQILLVGGDNRWAGLSCWKLFEEAYLEKK